MTDCTNNKFLLWFPFPIHISVKYCSYNMYLGTFAIIFGGSLMVVLYKSNLYWSSTLLLSSNHTEMMGGRGREERIFFRLTLHMLSANYIDISFCHTLFCLFLFLHARIIAVEILHATMIKYCVFWCRVNHRTVFLHWHPGI